MSDYRHREIPVLDDIITTDGDTDAQKASRIPVIDPDETVLDNQSDSDPVLTPVDRLTDDIPDFSENYYPVGDTADIDTTIDQRIEPAMTMDASSLAGEQTDTATISDPAASEEKTVIAAAFPAEHSIICITPYNLIQIDTGIHADLEKLEEENKACFSQHRDRGRYSAYLSTTHPSLSATHTDNDMADNAIADHSKTENTINADAIARQVVQAILPDLEIQIESLVRSAIDEQLKKR